MYKRKNTGDLGEDIAVEYLKEQGYEIIERNFRCKLGEIDIIALDKDEIVFIEVKTRKTLSYGNPGDSVNEPKQKHIYRTAEYYLLINGKLDDYTRLDVIEVYLEDLGHRINHIKKAIIDRTYEQKS